MARTTARRANVDDARPAAANYHANALARGLALLELLAKESLPLTLNDFNRSTGLPKSTLVRLLAVLQEMGYVIRVDERPAYRLGHKILALSTAYVSALDLSVVAGDYLSRLADETGQTANLGVLDGHEVLHVCVREPDRPIRFTTMTGARDAGHCTGLGKLLLSRVPPGDLAGHVPPEPFPARTDRTITALGALAEHLRGVAERGFALDDNEGSVGLRCVAVPVESGGVCLAALSVSGPSAEFDDEHVEVYRQTLHAAAQRLTGDEDVTAALRFLLKSLRPNVTEETGS
jgi:DNA-binding IclR family transcriptional regulator